MASAIRARAVPQCSACLRSYAWTSFADTSSTQQNALRQQVRGKKKNAKTTPDVVPARLMKDLPGYGKAGSIVPVSRGELRNYYFPRAIARYVTLTEQRDLRRNNVPIQRDYVFKKDKRAAATSATAAPVMPEGPPPTDERKAPEVERLTAQRSMELLDIFVSHRLDFYREPIMEEKPEEPVQAEDEKEDKKRRTASSAAADLLAARSPIAAEKSKAKTKVMGAIYGSVSQHDILVAIRAATATNDESAKVVITEQDIHFLDKQVQADNKIKLIGDFTVEIKVKGAEQGIRRTVRVVPQQTGES